MTKPTSIFHQVQQVIADQLNADETLSAANVRFVPENTKDIDFEVSNALGKQGIVGLVMTPTANYIGNTYDGELAYDLRDMTIQIVENPPVNRGLSASITALDAAQKVHELLSSPKFTTFGIMNPVSIEQGEEQGLIVAQAKFNCNIHAKREEPSPFEEGLTYYKQVGSEVWEKWNLSGDITGEDTYPYHSIPIQEVRIGKTLTRLGVDTFCNIDFPYIKKLIFEDGCSCNIGTGCFGGSSVLTSLENFENNNITQIEEASLNDCTALSTINIPSTVTSIGGLAFFGDSALTGIVIPSGCTSIGYSAFEDCVSLSSIDIPDNVQYMDYNCFQGCSGLKNVTIGSNQNLTIGNNAFYGCGALEEVFFKGRTIAEVQQMEEYPWGISNTDVIHAELG